MYLMRTFSGSFCLLYGMGNIERWRNYSFWPNGTTLGHAPGEEYFEVELRWNRAEGELLLNVRYKLKQREGLLPAGYIIAYDQLELAPYKFPLWNW